jgi:hypothetical protein
MTERQALLEMTERQALLEMTERQALLEMTERQALLEMTNSKVSQSCTIQIQFTTKIFYMANNFLDYLASTPLLGEIPTSPPLLGED